MYNVILDCYAINSMDDYIEPTITAVSEQFGLDSATVRDVICSEETKDSRYQVIKKEISVEEKQAFAAVGQARLMMVYQKLFAEYNQTAAQILMTKNTVTNPQSRFNAHNTFNELLKLGTIPIVNENDTVATDEIQFGDNDRLSAIVAALVEADILILMSDIDGLYTDDPNKNPDAAFIPLVRELTPELQAMGKGASSSVGTGGMSAKLAAAQIATGSGSDMLIANACDLNVIYRILEGEECGTLFTAHENKDFDLNTYLNSES